MAEVLSSILVVAVLSLLDVPNRFLQLQKNKWAEN
jgi:hypothetical protein